jgi:type IX secretion system PorP/SprF family membrane protein
MYLNPAFAGDAHHMKAGCSSRVMPQIIGGYLVNTLLHFNYKMINQTSGIGITFFNHTETLSHTKLQANYSHMIRLSEKSWIKGGLGVSINQRSTKSKSYHYPDQYDNLGFTGNPTEENNLKERSFFPGISAGIVAYSEMIWVSISGDYLNLPTENFAGQKVTYPLKLSFLSGILFPINKTSSKRRFSRFGGIKPHSSVGPVISFIYQDKYVEASGGLAFQHKPVFAALHYRYQHDYKLPDNTYAYNALVLMAGYRQEEFSLTYSYDYSLSEYTVNNLGAHELSVIFYFSSMKEDYKRHKLVPLPNQLFY